jgi:hypothetical protein
LEMGSRWCLQWVLLSRLLLQTHSAAHDRVDAVMGGK